MSENDITWEDPPAHKRLPAKCPATPKQIDEMRANPHHWMRVRDYDSANAASPAAMRIRKGGYSQLGSADAWEATARKTETGSAIWMQYLGTEREQSAAE